MSTEAFLVKKSTTQLIQEGLNIVQKLKQLNDNLNQNDPEDIQVVQEEINESKTKFQNSAQELKMIQQILDKQTLGIDQKAKVKQIKETYFKEVQRNKTLLSERINWLYENKALKDQRRQSYVQQRKSSSYRQSEFVKSSGQQSNSGQAKSDMEIQQEQLKLDLIPIDEVELDKLILEEKDQEINQLYQDAQELQKVVQDVTMQVSQQGESLEIVVDNQEQTKQNLDVTRKELNQAAAMQKKANWKCTTYAIIIGLLSVILIGFIVYVIVRFG